MVLIGVVLEDESQRASAQVDPDPSQPRAQMAGKAELAVADLRVAMEVRSEYRRLTPL
jgi:hypothetical protein